MAVAGFLSTGIAVPWWLVRKGACTTPHCDYSPGLPTLEGFAVVGALALVGGAITAYILWPSTSAPSKAAAAAATTLRIAPQVGLGWLGVGGRFR